MIYIIPIIYSKVRSSPHATCGTINTGITLHFGVENGDNVDGVIDHLLHNGPHCSIHSVYGDVVDGHNIVEVLVLTNCEKCGRKEEKDVEKG